MDNWIKAGKIAAEALEYGKKLIKPNVSLLEVADKIEAKIIQLRARPAFPVNISLNEIAAHSVPSYKDDRIFKKGDIVKLDIGTHIEGCIADTACTIDLGDNKKLVKAVEEALDVAIKICKTGIKVSEIGKVIQEKIQSYGFSPIKNLSGHEIKEYSPHAGLTIPNYDNGSNIELNENQVIAIEPFATTGSGSIIEGKPSGVFKLEADKNIRNPIARNILKFIKEEYKTLPFAKRWILNKFGLKGNFALNILEKEKIIYAYSELPEKAKGLVSQAEHTILIKEKPIILTKI